jgi:hypothetical protein
MTAESPTPENEPAGDPGPVLTLIKQIKESRIDPLGLSAEDRRRCVDVLGAEGYAVPEIAQILKRGERTIYRDRSDLRCTHALRVHPRFALEMAGELIRQAEGTIGRLRRIAREANASAMERAIAETSAFKVYAEMISKLQSLGYLPRVPTGIVAQVVGASGGEAIATYDQLAQRLKDLENVDQELGQNDPERRERRQMLQEIVRRGRMSAEVEQLFHPPQSEN